MPLVALYAAGTAGPAVQTQIPMRTFGKGSLAARVRAGEIPPDPAADDDAGPPRKTAWVDWTWARGTLALTALLHTIAFPPFNVPEVAFIFAVPMVLYALRSPRWIEFLVVSFTAFTLSWLVLLEWLRHVTIGGTIGLALMMAVFPTLWCAALRWAIPRAPWSDLLARTVTLLGLAGLWVVLEWTRSWFLTGFPWLPLAASMWQKPMMLQGAAIGGAWLVGFTLMYFNLGLASYSQRIWIWVKERRGRFSPEFYLAVLILFGFSFGVYPGRGPEREPWFRAGFVQPYIPQEVKWDAAKEANITRIIERQTREVAMRNPDVILWPEAVTPLPLLWTRRMNAWVENLVTETQIPILAGAVAFLPDVDTDPSDPEGTWSNAVFLVEPARGINERPYRKRHLVPFGEYVPMRRILSFIEKFVPIGGDFEPGSDAAPLLVNTTAGTISFGPLICYEDVFPNLARESVQAGVDLLFIATNNAWYGETGAAYQHAAHSVLRAVETRRVVVRDGNAGWSGWIDESGFIRHVVENPAGSVYFRGNQAADISRDPRWVGHETLYVQWGDWFVAVSAAIAGVAVLLLRSTRFRYQRLQ